MKFILTESYRVGKEPSSFKLLTIDLTDTYDSYVNNIKNIYGNLDDEILKDANINIKPRLRTLTLYYQAALNTKLNNGTYIVPGTSNKCELYVGYFTKGGDSVSDIQVLADLTVEQVIEVGRVTNVPKEVLYRAPDDGLSGLTDEDKLGVKYKDIAKYMNGEDLDIETKNKIERLHKNSLHKFNIPIYKKGE